MEFKYCNGPGRMCRHITVTVLIICCGLGLLMYCLHATFSSFEAALNADTVYNSRKEENTNRRTEEYKTVKKEVNVLLKRPDIISEDINHRAKEDKLVKKEVPNLLKSPNIISEDKIILVAAYMRTGSSLTGSIFNSYPGAFYVREPMGPLVSSFKALYKKNAKTMTFHYLNGTTRSENAADMDIKKTAAKEIKYWVQCKFEQISLESLSRVVKKSDCKPGTSNRCKRAIRSLKNECQKASIKVIKFIRLNIIDVLEILPLFPNMYIIHQVRDPRGMFNSRINLKHYTVDEYKTISVHGQCNIVFHNLQSTKKIFMKYPERIKVVRYEDMAEEPMQTWKEIMDFCRIEFKKEMKDFIKQATSSNQDSCEMCVIRKDSAATSKTWRTELQPRFGRYIYEACQNMCEVLGYLPLKSDSEQYNMTQMSMYAADIYRNLLHI